MRGVAVGPLDGFGGVIVVTDVAFKFARQVLDRGEDSASNDIELDLGEPVCGELLILAERDNGVQTCQRSRDG